MLSRWECDTESKIKQDNLQTTKLTIERLKKRYNHGCFISYNSNLDIWTNQESVRQEPKQQSEEVLSQYSLNYNFWVKIFVKLIHIIVSSSIDKIATFIYDPHVVKFWQHGSLLFSSFNLQILRMNFRPEPFDFILEIKNRTVGTLHLLLELLFSPFVSENRFA